MVYTYNSTRSKKIRNSKEVSLLSKLGASLGYMQSYLIKIQNKEMNKPKLKKRDLFCHWLETETAEGKAPWRQEDSVPFALLAY